MRNPLKVVGRSIVAIMLFGGLSSSAMAEEAAAPAAAAQTGTAAPAAAPAVAPAAGMSVEEMAWAEIPQVVTASKVAESAKTSPATVYVFTAKQIKERGYLDLKDILLDLPGIDISENIGGESGGWLVIPRGLMGNNKLQILSDGIPLNPASGDRFVWGNNISLDNVEQVEVIFGPASALYGADAMGGIINIITKKGSAINGHQVKALYGSANTADGSYLYGQKFSNGVDLEVFGRVFNSSGFDFKQQFPEIYGRLDTRPQSVETPGSRNFEAPIYDYDFSTKLSYENFTLMLSRSHYHENNTRGENINNYDMNRDAYWGFDKDIVAFKHTLPLSDSVHLMSQLSYDRYQVDPNSNYKYWAFNAYKYAEAKRTKLEEQLNVDFTKELQCIFGAELSETANQPYSFNFSDATKLDPNGLQWVPNPIYGYVDANGNTITFKGSGLISERMAGVFTQIKYACADNLDFVLGARYDWNSYYDYNVINPRAGIVYQPVSQATIKLLYGNAFISPSMWSSNIFWASPFFGHIAPAALGLQLKPERLESYEVNVNYEFTPKLVGTLDVYYNKSRDLIQGQSFYGPLNIIDAAGNTYYATRNVETARNQGEQNILGGDVVVKHQFLPGWELSASYSYITGTLNDPKDPKQTETYKVANHKGIVGITGSFLDHFGLYVRERLVGNVVTKYSNDYAGSDNGGNNRLDGYAVTDLNFRVFNVVKNAEFFLRVDNVLDAKYYGVGMDTETYLKGGNFLPRVPFDPRTIMGGITYSF